MKKIIAIGLTCMMLLCSCSKNSVDNSSRAESIEGSSLSTSDISEVLKTQSDITSDIVATEGSNVINNQDDEKDKTNGNGTVFKPLTQEEIREINSLYMIDYGNNSKTVVSDTGKVVYPAQYSSILFAEYTQGDMQRCNNVLLSNKAIEADSGEKGYIYAVGDMFGNIMTDYIYSYNYVVSDNILIIKRFDEETFDFLNPKTCEVVFQHKAGTSSAYVRKLGNKFLIMEYGEEGESTIYDQFGDYFKEFKNGGEIWFGEEENGFIVVDISSDDVYKYGLMDLDFNWVIDPEYDVCGSLNKNGLFTFQRDELFGVMNLEGEVLMEPTYNYMYESPWQDKYIACDKFDLKGVVDSKGNEIIPVINTEITVAGEFIAILDDNDYWHLYDENLKDVYGTGFENIDDYYDSHGYAFGNKNGEKYLLWADGHYEKINLDEIKNKYPEASEFFVYASFNPDVLECIVYIYKNDEYFDSINLIINKDGSINEKYINFSSGVPISYLGNSNSVSIKGKRVGNIEKDSALFYMYYSSKGIKELSAILSTKTGIVIDHLKSVEGYDGEYIIATKGFKKGLMDLEGNWVYSESIFSTFGND